MTPETSPTDQRPVSRKNKLTWGPYVSNRQWGTVREDYSATGTPWTYLTHDMARSKAYRWGEEGIAGICDSKQRLCFAVAFWNGKDPILKERFFGLSGVEGNHGEDLKELFYYLDATPTHSYLNCCTSTRSRYFLTSNWFRRTLVAAAWRQSLS
jgi:hypothetical protein